MEDRFIAYDMRRLHLFVAYIMWALVGLFGAHRFYLKRRRTATVQLVLFVVFLVVNASSWTRFLAVTHGTQTDLFDALGALGVHLLLITASLPFLAIALTWWAVDGFLVRRYVRVYNGRLPQEVGYAKELSN